MKSIAKGIQTISLVSLLSCTPTAYARHTYQNPQQQQREAFEDMELILANRCCRGNNDSYPQCHNFSINKQGFHCGFQRVQGSYGIVASFSWDQIQSFHCDAEDVLHISDRYDSSKIFMKDARQCQNLERAMQIYIAERKK